MKYDCEIDPGSAAFVCRGDRQPGQHGHGPGTPGRMSRLCPAAGTDAAPCAGAGGDGGTAAKAEKDPLEKAPGHRLAVCAVTAVCVGGGYGLYNHTTPVTLEQAALWPFVTQMEGEKVYVVETQGRNVRLEVCPEVGFGGLNAVRAVAESPGSAKGWTGCCISGGGGYCPQYQAVLRQDQAI